MSDRQRDEKPWTDEIVAQVRAAREQIFAECNYDLSKLAERLRKAQEASGRIAVTYPRKAPQKPVPA
jgi:hypothetical protein